MTSINAAPVIFNTIEPPVSDHPNVTSRWSLTGGGRLREFRPYWVKILPQYHVFTVETPCFKCFIHVKSQIQEKIHYFSLRNFHSLVLPRNVLHLIIQFMLYYLLSGCLWEVKNFQL